MEGFLIQGWGLILPGCGGTLTFPRGQLPPRALRPLIGRGRAGAPARPMGLALGKRWIETHLHLLYYQVCYYQVYIRPSRVRMGPIDPQNKALL